MLLFCRCQRDATSLHGQTIRVLIVNADTLKNRKDAVLRFARAYREAVDWMYTSADAPRLYAEKTKIAEVLVKDTIAKYHTRAAMQTDAVNKLTTVYVPQFSKFLADATGLPSGWDGRSGIHTNGRSYRECHLRCYWRAIA